MNLPDNVRSKIEEQAFSIFPFQEFYSSNWSRALAENQRNEFIKGAEFSYQLATEELERMMVLIEEAYLEGRNFHKSDSGLSWQSFKQVHNL